MKIAGIPFYSAHPTNFTLGREGRLPKYFTVHHMAALNDTLRYLWGNPDRNGSSHFGAFNGYAEQYVDTNDTAWCNGNWQSNLDSISCETRGDWRNGYYDQATLNTLTEVMYQCLKVYPNLQLTYHMDVSSTTTLCPADLKHRGYAAQCWANAKNRIAVENQAAQTPAVNLRTDIPDKKVILIRDTNLWDMGFTTWAGAKAVKALPKGTVIDVAGIYNHTLGGKYYLSNYSWNNGINNGINVKDCEDYVPPVEPPKPPVVDPPIVTPPVVTPPVDNPPTNEGSGTIPPVPVDPNGDVIKRLTALEQFVALLKEFFSKINWKFWEK